MAIVDRFETSEHRKNIAHFGALVSIAKIDGEISPEEEGLIKSFAKKLNIREEEYNLMLKSGETTSINPLNSREERLERIYELFKIIYADHYIDDAERKLIYRYALGLGCTSDKADEVIRKSMKIFGGNIDFEDYKYLMSK
ncbi:TerB family tellurite resistance protein [Flavobacteriaceae bacterium F08102]|nr:TerB family tellurite resistance protein [Flavobacteriaceae bacterium F08102]